MHTINIQIQTSSRPKRTPISLIKRGKMAVKPQSVDEWKLSNRKVASSYDSSDYDNDGDDEEHYFSDASATSSSSRRSWSSSSESGCSTSSSQSHQMGDFVFDDEDFAQYFAQMRTPSGMQIPAEKAWRSSEPSSVPMQRTRKASSAFFLSSSRMASLPRLSYSQPSTAHKVDSTLYRSRQTRAAAFSRHTDEADSSSDEEFRTKAVALAVHSSKAEDEDFHRALMFANFHRSQQGQWQAPEGVNETLQQLVASLH